VCIRIQELGRSAVSERGCLLLLTARSVVASVNVREGLTATLTDLRKRFKNGFRNPQMPAWMAIGGFHGTADERHTKPATADASRRGSHMRGFKTLLGTAALLAGLALAPAAKAQVAVEVGVPPVCAYGYYD
jgi:hypothetical protein